MCWFRSYDEESEEIYDYLTGSLKMKPQYAQPFLKAYGNRLGKMLYKGKKKSTQLLNRPGLESTMLAIDLADPRIILVSQAYKAYMSDLRSGRYVRTPVENAIWAILAEHTDMLEQIDRSFSEYIEENQEELFPGLLDKVFDE